MEELIAEYRMAVLKTERVWGNLVNTIEEGTNEQIAEGREFYNKAVRDEANALEAILKTC